jgi:multiple sugar transport system permease protein
LSDDRYLHSIRVTLAYTVAEVPLKLAVALVLAVALDKGIRGLTAYRAMYYVPSLLGGSVAVSIAWRQMFGVRGVVDGWLAMLGWPNAPAFIDGDVGAGATASAWLLSHLSASLVEGIATTGIRG